MCGIAGILVGPSQSVPAGALEAMNAALVHRGPDEDGAFIDGNVGLAMRRLSIVGLANGRQPIFNEDGNVVLVMNGEIYNYRDLREQLEREGHRFATDSDTEVLVHLYEARGSDGVNALRGMFAFALYDRRRRRLILGRDRLGKKPLYYALKNGVLLFASEIKALHASGLVPDEMDVHVLDAYLAHGFVLGEKTLFKEIRKLPAGCLLEATGTTRDVRRYWNLPLPSASATPFPEAASRVRTLLDEAVRIRLMSEVPLGAFLSGGIDSSAVVGLMRRHLDAPIDTFVVGFDDPKFDELAPARAVAEHFGTRHHELVVSRCEPELLQTMNWYHDEPAGDPAVVPTFCVARFARQRIKVALTGEGGDEIFGGYRRYAEYRRLLRLERTVVGFGPVARALHGCERFAWALGPRRFWRAIWIATLAGPERPRAWLSIFTDAEIARLRADPAAVREDATERREGFRALQREARNADWVGQSMYIDARSQLADRLLMKVDKMTMAVSLEARCPFLDQELISYVAGLSTDMKLSAAGSKLLLREALRGIVPNEVLTRRKHGYEVPIRRWLLGDLSPLVSDLLLVSGGPIDDYVSKPAVRKLWQLLQQRDDQELAKQVWILLNLAVWHDAHWGVPLPVRAACA